MCYHRIGKNKEKKKCYHQTLRNNSSHMLFLVCVTSEQYCISSIAHRCKLGNKPPSLSRFSHARSEVLPDRLAFKKQSYMWVYKFLAQLSLVAEPRICPVTKYWAAATTQVHIHLFESLNVSKA